MTIGAFIIGVVAVLCFIKFLMDILYDDKGGQIRTILTFSVISVVIWIIQAVFLR